MIAESAREESACSEAAQAAYSLGMSEAASALPADRPTGGEGEAGGLIIQLPLDWSGLSDATVQHVNQVLAQIGAPAQDGMPDGIYLGFGSTEPQAVFGDEEERRRAYQAIGALKVTVHGRFHISRGHLRDLVSVLEEVGRQYDAITESSHAPKAPDQR
jgi:hypothetical protein